MGMGMGMGIRRRRMGLAEREGRHGQGEFKKQEPSWFQLLVQVIVIVIGSGASW